MDKLTVIVSPVQGHYKFVARADGERAEGYGNTPAEAIGDLVMKAPTTFNIGRFLQPLEKEKK